MAFTSQNQIWLNSTFSAIDGIGTATQSVGQVYQALLSEGTGSNQADVQYADRMTITGGGNIDFDLTNRADAFGNDLGIATVVEVFIASADANTTDLTIGGSSADFPGVPAQTIAPSGWAYYSNRDAGLGSVTNNTTDTIRISNAAGATATVDVYILGRSA